MPEYNSSKRRKMTGEELRAEYRKADSKAKRSNVSRKERKIIEEARTAPPPTSPARVAVNNQAEARRKEELRRRKEQEKQKKRRDTRKRKSMMLYYIMFGLLIITVFSILSVTVLFNITEIEIKGESVYSDDEIIAAAEVSAGDNLVRFGAASAEEKILEKLVYIDEVMISRSFPNKLVISVTAAEPMICVEMSGKYYIASYNSKLLGISDEPADCPLVKGLDLKSGLAEGSTLEGLDEENAERLEAVIDLVNEMKLLELDKSADIDVSDIMDIKMVYDNRISMELGSAIKLHEKMYAASVLLETEISENDRLIMLLSNPERVVTRPVYSNQGDNDYIATSEDTEAPEEETTEGEPSEPETE